MGHAEGGQKGARLVLPLPSAFWLLSLAWTSFVDFHYVFYVALVTVFHGGFDDDVDDYVAGQSFS